MKKQKVPIGYRIAIILLIFISLLLCCISISAIGLSNPDKECPECEKCISECPKCPICEEKIVEVENENCKKAISNEEIYIQIVAIDNEAFLIVSDVFENIEYYLYNPAELDYETGKLFGLARKKEVLMNQLEE